MEEACQQGNDRGSSASISSLPFHGGYGDGSINWEQFSNYAHANNLPIVPPAIYNDNASVSFHPAYGFDTQVAYSQFSPMASSLSPIMIDGQLYSPHQVPISPSYYSRPVSPNLPNVTSALSNGLATPASSGQEGLNENVFLNPYYLHYGSFGGGSHFGNDVFGFYNYPRDFGSDEFGSYEHSFGQIPQECTPNSGYGPSGSSTRRYQRSGYSQGSNYRSISVLVPENGGKQRERDSVSTTSESHGTASDHDRVPRASKTKVDSTCESEYDLTSQLQIERYNQPEFETTYENGKFFVIKSYSEDNVHKSIKYGVWASTTLGNRKLDAAYQDAKAAGGTCPVFLFFSVNASGQFCGVAEMVGPVDFENNADYWQQDRWSGQFRVEWHIIKDVPNSRFRHILLQNNDSKPVTHSRDSQEVKLEEGIAMLKIFKEYDADTSILDDFNFYDEREMDIQEKRSKDRDFSAKNASITAGDASVTQLSDRMAISLQLEEHKEVQ